MESFHGLRIVVQPDPKPYSVRRSIWERFLSRPWRPWIAERTVIPEPILRDNEVIKSGNTITMNPRTYDALRILSGDVYDSWTDRADFFADVVGDDFEINF